MSDMEVRIVRLEPMRVAIATGFGSSPENLAWQTLCTWAEQKGLLKAPEARRFFGFNNPSPTPASPNYGYEMWMTVGPEVTAELPVKIKSFEGGLYAVARVTGVENIYDAWQKLVAWVHTSPYTPDHRLCLEEHVRFMDVAPDEFVMDLFEPVKESVNTAGGSLPLAR